jgi:hypothetical protein
MKCPVPPISKDELRRRTEVALREQGISLCEYFILCSAGYRVNDTPKRYIEHAIWASRGDHRGRFSDAEFFAAYERCIARGLLKVLEPSDFDATGARKLPSPRAARDKDSGGVYGPGHVDFTERGSAIHAAITHSVFGWS